MIKKWSNPKIGRNGKWEGAISSGPCTNPKINAPPKNVNRSRSIVYIDHDLLESFLPIQGTFTRPLPLPITTTTSLSSLLDIFISVPTPISSSKICPLQKKLISPPETGSGHIPRSSREAPLIMFLRTLIGVEGMMALAGKPENTLLVGTSGFLALGWR